MEPLSPRIRDGNLVLPSSGPGPLLPELSQLQWLEELSIGLSVGQPWAAGVPAEWGQPGAFPRLKE